MLTQIEVEVFNVSKSGSKTHVGAAKAKMKDVAPQVGGFCSYIFDLVYRKKGVEEKIGQVVLRAKLAVAPSTVEPVDDNVKPTPTVAATPTTQKTDAAVKPKDEVKQPETVPSSNKQPAKGTDPAPSTTVPPATSKGKPSQLRLVLDGLQAKELVDTGSFMDGQDPAMRVTVGGEEKITQRMQDAGTAAAFPEVFEFMVDAAQYDSGLEVSVLVMWIEQIHL